MTVNFQALVRGIRGKVLWAGAAVLACLTGCGDGSSAPGNATVYEVKGKILLPGGKPLSGGHVYFVPRDGALTPEAPIGPDGTFTLVSGPSGEGAPAGEYKIRIEPSDPSLFATTRPSNRRKTVPFSAKYLDEDSSGLKVAVKAEPNRLEPIILKSH